MNLAPQQELNGTIERIVYTNSQTGFVIFVLDQSSTTNSITVQGTLPSVHAGQAVTIEGNWQLHPKFGKQFCATRCTVHKPTSIIGLQKYLGSGMIKGVGPSCAKLLVDAFGQKVLEVIEKEPEKLARVKGIGPKRAAMIQTSWHTQKEASQLMVFLQDRGISVGYATRIYKHYGNRALEVIQNNPYQLAQDIWGIGFKLADQLAKALDFAHDGDERVQAGIFFTLTTISGSGSLYCTQELLIEKTIELLTLIHQDKEAQLIRLIATLVNTKSLQRFVYDNKEFVSITSHYVTEKQCAQRLTTLLKYDSCLTFNLNTIYHRLRTATHINLHEQQQLGIFSCLQNKVSIITGGPGTGKTTIIKTVLQILDEYKATYLLAAPTGRAAKRMQQATGKPSMTMHRLLEFDPSIMKFTRDEKNALPAQFIIIDEASMIDIFLAHALLKAIQLHAHLLFIGDIDQLPSVGPGNFLRDLLESKIIPSTQLSHIFRQAQNSLIIMNAHRINQGQMPTTSLPECNRDFFFIKEDNPENIPLHLEKIYQSFFPTQQIKADESIVLVPMNRGSAGTQKLNTDLQSILNSNTTGPTITRFGITYKINDRIMQTRNNYDKLVFNGDIGTVQEIDSEDQTMTILFGDRPLLYELNELDEIVLAYAISIHKSQGSEFRAVIIPIFTQHFMLLARNLLYTAVTRAKQLCIFIGQVKAIAMAIKNNESHKRVTFLKEFLNGTLS